MDAEQGKDMRTGGVPALNIERIYSTTVPAEELARALADHFRAQETNGPACQQQQSREMPEDRARPSARLLRGDGSRHAAKTA
jgi:hypothetical protein